MQCFIHMRKQVLPEFCKALVRGRLLKNDFQLTAALHERGINCRFLGEVYDIVCSLSTTGRDTTRVARLVASKWLTLQGGDIC